MVPEKPEMLRGFVLGLVIGPSASKSPLIPLTKWPPGLRLESILSPALVRRLSELQLNDDHGSVARLTIGDFLILPRFGPRSVISFGCEVEAGVNAFLTDGTLPPWAATTGVRMHRPQAISTWQAPSDSAGSSVPALVESRFGVKVECSNARFKELGWTFQGEPDIICGDCDSEIPFIIYRKPYTTSQGSYRYWAIVCLTCRTVSALQDFQRDDQELFRAWDTEAEVQEVSPTAPEEPEAELNPDSQPLGMQSPKVTSEEAPQNPIDFPPAVEPSAKPNSVAADPPEVPSQGAVAIVDPFVIAAAKAELSASSGQVRQVHVGRAQRDSTESSIVFRVAGPSIDLSEQPPGEVFLAASMDDTARYKVEVRYASATEAVVVATTEVPAKDPLHLFLTIDPGVVAKAFVDYLEKCKSPRLAAVLAGRGQLSVGAPEQLSGLNAEQNLAAGAITSPGVAVIWGPPGTGKTRVIGAAVAELLSRGRSVALVSNTNVAVDQALLHVCRVAEPFEAGSILRIGHPSIPEVSEHPMLLSSKAIQIKFEDLIGELGRLQVELNSAREAAAVAGDGRLDELLKGYNIASLEELVQRQRSLTGLALLNEQLATLTARLGELQFAREAAGKNYDQARERCARWAEYLGILEDEREVASLNSAIKDGENTLKGIDQQLQQAAKAILMRHRRTVRELTTARTAAEKALATAMTKRETHIRRLEQASQKGVTPAVIRAEQDDEAAAESEWRTVKEQIAETEASMQRLSVEAQPLRGLAELTEHEILILGHIDRCGSVKHLNKEVLERKRTSERWADRIRKLSSKIEGLQRKLHDQEATLIAEAKVVGTTLAQLVLNRGLTGRTFDHVVIDEASSALPPYVYAAMTKADSGCTFVGDFEQNWPITRCDEEERRKLPTEVNEWLTSNPFGLIGIRSSEDATSNSGCVVLRNQYRFGEHTMKLANAIAYDGLLRHGRRIDAIPIDGPEIVIIDTAELAGGALVEKGPGGSGRWWAAGAALSHELARRHNFDAVGVVTPYRAQVQLTRAQLKDGGGALVNAGTAHAFQGREFPVVIVDLVEDGTGTSWVARGDRRGSEWSRTGARLFNVAVTRNSGRLYVISNVGCIQSAKSGPLRELGAIVRSGGAEVWDARSLLGSHIPPTHTTSEVFTFEQSAISTILDDGDFYDSLLKDLELAMQRVDIYSPFVTRRRLEKILPVLRELKDRGVKVTVFTKATHELSDPGLLTAMRDDGVVVHERERMHEKVVIVDQHVTYVGSLNPLSNTGRTGEIMLRLNGQETTGKIAQWMRSRGRR